MTKQNNTTPKLMENKTAIEWLENEIVRLEILFAIPNAIYKLCEMAKEKEKKQIVNAVDGFPLENRNLDGEQYYNETYGK